MNPRILPAALAFALASLVFGACDPGDADTDAGDSSLCEPACRSGFVCLRGECVSACNPACDFGQRCSDEGMCVTDETDGGSDDAGTPMDGSPEDASMDDGAVPTDSSAADAASDAGVPTSCPEGEVLCSGACRAPTLPDVGVRTPTTATWGTDWFQAGDSAVDPCTGNVGLVYAQQIARGVNTEVYVTIVSATLGTPATTPVRITTAPGAADSVAIAWAGDRFGVFWADPRHDPAPETCTRCLTELYYAAVDTSGAVVVPEVRLTTHASSYRAASTRAAWGPDAHEIGVTWADSEGSREVHAAIVSPAGVMRDEQVVSMAADPQRGNSPRIVWNDGGWVLLYRHDDPSGSRPDYLHTRTLDVSGSLSTDLDLRVPAEQIALTARGTLGYATVTTGGSPLSLRLWDLGWTATTTLPNTSGTFDGSRGLAWDGANLYLTNTGGTFEIIELNGLGTETGRIPLTSDSRERNARNIRMHRIGSRLVMMWVWSTGGLSPLAHHRVQIVDTASAM